MTKPIDTPVLIRQSKATRRYDLTIQAFMQRRDSDPTFPEPIRNNSRSVFYRLAELDHYFGVTNPTDSEAHA